MLPSEPLASPAAASFDAPLDMLTTCHQKVLRFCARHLEDHMVPKIVEFRDSLPRTDSGKASRRLAATPANPTGSNR